MSCPLPRQATHGSLKPNAPWLRLTKPLPPQVGQRRAAVPGLAPDPWHRSHAAGPDSRSGNVAPCAACSKSSVSSALTSCPRVGPPPLRVPVRPADDPNSPSNKSFRLLPEPPPNMSETSKLTLPGRRAPPPPKPPNPPNPPPPA